MFKRIIITGAIGAMVLGLLAPAASADDFRRAARSSTRGKAPASLARSHRGSTEVLRDAGRILANSRSSKGYSSNTPILDAIRQANGNGRYNGYNGDRLGNALNEAARIRERKNYLDYRNDREEEYLKNERAAIISNAVVGVVGILADSQRGGYVQSAPVAACPPPPAPAGYWQTQRVVVQPGRYVNQQVWVPDQRDPYSNSVILGHYETHQVWVPPVYQETQVWVQR
ncbi:MAG: hypothetical protein GC168_09785 [Candidatus Hydrogenedens sp.]|nr:hypothetical protein [Candidatus Hydrogenedens sp.]